MSTRNWLLIALAVGLMVTAVPAEAIITQEQFIGFDRGSAYAHAGDLYPVQHTTTSLPLIVDAYQQVVGTSSYAQASVDHVDGTIRLFAVSTSPSINVTASGGVLDMVVFSEPNPATKFSTNPFDAFCFDDSGFRLTVSASGTYSGSGGGQFGAVGRLTPTDPFSHGLLIESQTGDVGAFPNGSFTFMLPVGTYYLDIGATVAAYGVGVADMYDTVSYAITGPDGGHFGSASGAFPIAQPVPVPVPEPSTVFLMGAGLAGLAFARRFKG